MITCTGNLTLERKRSSVPSWHFAFIFVFHGNSTETETSCVAAAANDIHAYKFVSSAFACVINLSLLLNANKFARFWLVKYWCERIIVVMAVRVQFENNNEIGVFSKLTNSYCLTAIGGSENFYRWSWRHL